MPYIYFDRIIIDACLTVHQYPHLLKTSRQSCTELVEFVCDQFQFKGYASLPQSIRSVFTFSSPDVSIGYNQGLLDLAHLSYSVSFQGRIIGFSEFNACQVAWTINRS